MKVCPSCGTQNRPTANFCKGCRSPLGAAPAAPAAPAQPAAGGAGTTMCPIGHIYPANLPGCPYCPKGGGAGVGKAAPTRQEAPGGGGKPLVGKAAPTRPPRSERARPARKATKIAKEERPLAGWLVVLSSRSEEIYRDYKIFDGRNKIGRAGGGAQIQVNDEEISGDHAVIAAEDEEYFVTDVGSANGTYVNGAKVRDVQVSDGDFIKVGKTVLVVCTFKHRAQM